jgi:hypothetical protein
VVPGKAGSFKMIIEDRALSTITKKWEYQLKDTDGVLYENGVWVPESRLNSTVQ